MNYNEDYVKSHLIAYIGNKRRLLPLIEKSIEMTGVLNSKENPLFLDLFAGTGSVSRLAKSIGFDVLANDWEYYSYVINKAFVELDEDFLKNSFSSFGGIKNTLSILNDLNTPNKEDRYISLYYCPEDDDYPDTKNERMFYTNYNGKKIDAIRAKILEWVENKLINEKEECLLIALLLYEASVRSNTSGVFKAFHRGFGGTNGDALNRILKPVELRVPKLINAQKSRAYKEDAVKLSEDLRKQKFDIVYIDPPYNQHQYGSNYHLLNTIAQNDKPIVNKNVYINGKKINKSAIRRDWVKTKSSFCYKKTAKDDFKKIIKNINADYILLSYSIDGIIPFDQLLEILSKKGWLDICLSEYTKYRGGKQALTTEIKNIEFVLIVNTNKKGSQEDIARIKKILIVNKINLFMKKTINPIRTEAIGFSFVSGSKMNSIGEKVFQKTYFNESIIFQITDNKISNHDHIIPQLFNLSLEVLTEIYDDLEYITSLTREDEIYLSIDEIIKYYRVNMYKKAIDTFKEIPYYISKFNNKKAYVPSLKSIISVLDMMIQTIDMWKHHNIINYSCFKDFEKIILLKLNHNADKDYSTRKKDEFMPDENISYKKKIDEYKKQISSLYEYFINIFEKDIQKIEKYESSNLESVNQELWSLNYIENNTAGQMVN
ncbi:MAG: DNA adenine methylase [Spirochaetes bacterium]|nr:DNA adenine methylase [Spirochaetota bacterium]